MGKLDYEAEQPALIEKDRESFSKRVLITVGIVIPVILLLLLFGFAFKVLLLVLAGVLFAVFFRGIAGWISNHTKLSEGWSLLIAVVGVVGLIVLAGRLIAPQVGEQVNQLSEKLPQAVANTRSQLEQKQWGKKLLDQIPKSSEKVLQRGDGWFEKSFGFVSSTFGVLADLYVILFIGLFIMAQPKPYRQGIVHLVPVRHRDRARQVLHKLGVTLQRWIAGKLLSMLVVAVLTTLGLWLLDVPVALALGIIAGLLSFIPNFGPIIALLPAVLIAFTQGPNTALYITLLYMGVQAVESNLITPLVQKKMVYLPPAMIIISQVLLGILVGGLGLILATPLIAILMVLIQMLYVEDVLGDSVQEK